MKKTLFKQIEISGGITVNLEESKITIKGPEGEISRNFNPKKVKIKIEENKIILGQEKASKNEKKIMNTFYSHIRNMIKGVKEKFEYKLKICFGHFPFTVKQEGEKVVIKNFFGEKVERIVEIPKGVDIEIKKDLIFVRSVDKELAGQASANFEMATKIGKKDKRIFQDGIYITEKDGKKI